MAERTIFLDLDLDRYFCLPDHLTATFHALAAGIADGEKAEAIDRLLQMQIVRIGPGDGRIHQVAIMPAVDQLRLDGLSRIRIGFVVDAIVNQLRARLWLRWLTISTITAKLARRKMVVSKQLMRPGRPSLADLMRSFDCSDFLFTRSDCCLARSLALMTFLTGQGITASLVFGVRIPFSAHCWVQADDQVINDDVDNVRNYQPILVL